MSQSSSDNSTATPSDGTSDGKEGVISASEEAAPPPWYARRKVWWSVRAVLLIAVAPVLMALVAAVVMIGREVTAPSWVVRDVEARAAQVLGGGSLGFESMKVTVGDDLHPRIVLRNAVLRDADQALIAQVPRIEGLLSPRGVLQGRILAQEVSLRGAQIWVRRAMDGSVAFAFDQSANAVAAADGFVGLLDQLDQAFEGESLEALEQVQANGLIINYVDVRAGRSWVIDNGRIDLDVRDAQTTLRADIALLSGRSFVTNAEVTYTSPRGTRSADIGVRITDAAAPDIASQSPLLAWLGVLDAPISGAVRGTLDDQGALDAVSATLQIGGGQLRPNSASRPIPFSGAQTYLSYDPSAERLTFNLIEVDSELGRVSGSGQAYLREFEAGWPGAILGQLQFSDITVAASDLYDQAVAVAQAGLDFRLRLDPFTLDIGQAAVSVDGVPVLVSGRVAAASEGWSVALDVSADEIGTDKVLRLWPRAAAGRTRQWLETNVTAGTVRDAEVAFRVGPGQPRSMALSMEYLDATVVALPSLPPIEAARGTVSLIDKRLAVTLDRGYVNAPQGGRIDMDGSTFVVPQTGPRAPARFDLAMAGRMTAAMSILNEPPFRVLRNSDLPVSFAQGQARIDVDLETPLGRDVSPSERVWQARAALRGVRSEVLIEGRVLTSSSLQVRADPDSLVVQGPVRLGQIGAEMTFSRALGAGSEGTARVDLDTRIGPDFLQAFNIRLPSGMVRGEGAGRIEVDLSDPSAPDFRLTSDLRGIGLSLAGVGWSKAPSARGALTVAGQLGTTPRIDELSIEAPGLQTSGQISLVPGGGLDRAAFERVRLGGWLDAPVILVGRGQGRPAEIRIAAGSLDLRSANFGGGGGGNAGGPMDIALDRLRVTDDIVIDDFRGTFTQAGGLQGTFQGNVNGSAPVAGTLVPVDGRAAVRITADDAGALLRATGLLRGALGGQMQMTLIPAGSEGSYDGQVVGRNLRVRDAPALASLLDAISVVGLLTQLDGQGLMFTDVDARFRLTPDQVIITQSSAVGPSIGLSLDGIYAQGTREMDFQGVVSPVYLLNGIGAVLTRPGEGLIGFNFNLRGPVDSARVNVNPLSALTPGMFREIFRRPPPTVGQ